MSDFNKVFEKLCYMNDNTIVFLDFLDYMIAGFNINPNYKWGLRGKYGDDEKNLFFSLFQELVKETREKLDSGEDYFDYLGLFYEEHVKSGAKASARGQFFTPQTVSDLLSQLATSDDEVDVRHVYDCCAGSGRLLLAHHARRPLDIIHAEELDDVAARMCVINFMLHGVKGSVCCVNSLSRDFYWGFKTNEMIDVLDGVPSCMDIDEEWMANVFIGVPVGSKEEDEGVVLNTGQTTLI